MFVQRENHAGAPHLIHEHVVEQERQGIHDSVIAPYLTVVDSVGYRLQYVEKEKEREKSPLGSNYKMKYLMDVRVWLCLYACMNGGQQI